jgi:hypothetical protein
VTEFLTFLLITDGPACEGDKFIAKFFLVEMLDSQPSARRGLDLESRYLFLQPTSNKPDANGFPRGATDRHEYCVAFYLMKLSSSFPPRNVLAGLVASLLLALPMQASLLTPAYEDQLETWLGQGDLDFTAIYTKADGDNATTDFHAAVDGQGPTFFLMTISGHGLDTQVIGGYNPLSWGVSAGYDLSPNDAERTSFIFNLTDSIVQRQNLTTDGGAAGSNGQYGAYNNGLNGPTFGGGNDISVDNSLSTGRAINFSYGGTTGGAEIVSGSPNNGGSTFNFDIGELEVYTFAPAADTGSGSAVPDAAGTAGLIVLSLAGLMALRRRLT